MPAFWIYKCNSKRREHQRTWGDWTEVFASASAQRWGTTRIVPELAKAKIGDVVLAYQTDRNELVGIARVAKWLPDGKHKSLVVKPLRSIGVRVRPLKESNLKVARIPALQPGPIHTLYEISHQDANILLKAVGTYLQLADEETEEGAEQAFKGAGFGTYEQNKKIERAAIAHVKRYFKAEGWSVEDVSSQNRGYDLLCTRAAQVRHVEVKGARRDGQQFVITRKELNAWSRDVRFVLAFVGNALSSKSSPSFFPKAVTQKEFTIEPLSFMATRKPNFSSSRREKA